LSNIADKPISAGNLDAVLSDTEFLKKLRGAMGLGNTLGKLASEFVSDKTVESQTILLSSFDYDINLSNSSSSTPGYFYPKTYECFSNNVTDSVRTTTFPPGVYNLSLEVKKILNGTLIPNSSSKQAYIASRNTLSYAISNVLRTDNEYNIFFTDVSSYRFNELGFFECDTVNGSRVETVYNDFTATNTYSFSTTSGLDGVYFPIGFSLSDYISRLYVSGDNVYFVYYNTLASTINIKYIFSLNIEPILLI
jgi:hypothetical protein